MSAPARTENDSKSPKNALAVGIFMRVVFWSSNDLTAATSAPQTLADLRDYRYVTADAELTLALDPILELIF